MKFKVLFITLIMTLALHSSVFAQDNRDGRHPVGALKAALSLSEDQVNQFRDLIQARSAAIKENADEAATLKHWPN